MSKENLLTSVLKGPLQIPSKELIMSASLSLMLTGCTAGDVSKTLNQNWNQWFPNGEYCQTNSPGEAADFGDGIINGVVSPFSLGVSIFNPNVCVTNPDNNGFPYESGFKIGVCLPILIFIGKFVK